MAKTVSSSIIGFEKSATNIKLVDVISTTDVNFIWGSGTTGLAFSTAATSGTITYTMPTTSAVIVDTLTTQSLVNKTLLGDSEVAATPSVIIKAAASQTGNLTTWQNSSGTTLAEMLVGGNFRLLGGTIGLLESGSTPTYYTYLASADLTGADITFTLPASDGDANQFLQTNGSGVMTWATAATVGGADTQVQFNDGGVLNGDATFTFNKTTDVLSAKQLNLSSKIGILESAGATYYTYLQGGDQTADITYTLPTTVGSAGQAMQNTGSGVLSWADMVGASEKVTYTADGTWTVPSGVKYAFVVVVGGGGAGGRFNVTDGGGGGGGAVVAACMDVSGIASVAITIGAGGDGDIVAPTSGEDTTFGSYITAGGGTAGTNGGAGGAGGTVTIASAATGGLKWIQAWATGGAGSATSVAGEDCTDDYYTSLTYGTGGTSERGAGGGGGGSYNNGGNGGLTTGGDATGYGGGGGGAGSTGQVAGDGAPGVVIIYYSGGGESAGTPPGGANTQVQYNDGGVFGGDSGFTFNETTDFATLVGGLVVPLIRPASDSTTAVRIQNSAGGTSVLTVDTTNTRIGVGATPSASLDVLGTFRVDSNGRIVRYNNVTPPKGTILVGDASYFNPLAVGVTNGYVLMIDSAEPTGIKWGPTLSGAGGANTQVQYNDSGALNGDSTFTFNETTKVISGQQLNLSSKLGILEGTGATYYTYFQGGDQTADVTYTLPPADGTNAQVLKTDGSGGLSWATVTTGSEPPGGVSTNIQFNDGGTFGGDADFTFTKATNTVTLTGPFNMTGDFAATGEAQLISDAAAAIPLSVKGAASQSGHYIDVTTNGGSAGDIFYIDSTGIAVPKYLKVVGTTKQTNSFYAGSTDPTATTRLNLDGYFYATRVYNAVWNDIADFFEIQENIEIEYGKVYVIDENEVISVAKEYCAAGIVGIASDTYGFGIGSREDRKQLPVAVAGIVLAKVDGIYPPGTPLTSSKNGELTEITDAFKTSYPERIIATFHKKESKEEWNGVKVNGRHWVKVR